MANVLRLLNHTTIDDKRGHIYDIFWVKQGTAGSGNYNELPIDTTKTLPAFVDAAVLADPDEATEPSVSLFYGWSSTGPYGRLRLTGGTADEEVAVVTRRDTGNAGAGSTQTYPDRFS